MVKEESDVNQSKTVKIVIILNVSQCVAASLGCVQAMKIFKY